MENCVGDPRGNGLRESERNLPAVASALKVSRPRTGKDQVQDLVFVSNPVTQYIHSFRPPQSEGKNKIALGRNIRSYFPF